MVVYAGGPIQMLEKQIEELIAKFPEEFFQRKKLVLKDRQKSFAGVGRFDLRNHPHGTFFLAKAGA